MHGFKHVAAIEVSRAVEEAKEVLEELVGTAARHTREVVSLYEDFKRELDRGAPDVDEYVRLAEELERDVVLDAEALRRLLGRGARLVGAGDVMQLDDLSAFLKRVGCRLGRRDVVLLGIAVGYAFGGMAKEALCALLASAAAEKGREEYVLEIGERCGVDLVFLEKITCNMAKLADEEGLDYLAGVSQVFEELREGE